MNESANERRQRQAAERALKSAMPNVKRLAEQISRQQTPLADVAKAFSRQQQELLASVAAQTRQATDLTSTFKAFKFDIPALRLDYKTLFPDLGAIQKHLIKQALPSIQLVQEIQRKQFANIIAQAQAAMRAALPPNWRSDDIHLPKNLEALLLDEGLALAWVPPGPVVAKLFDADTAARRRKIIGSHWRGISRACLDVLESISDSTLAEHVQFATEAAGTLRAGRHIAAQALSANLLDTILRSQFDGPTRNTITGQKTRLDIGDYPLRVAVVLGGIWGAHGEFWVSNGDKIPREFSRHGSAHGVSRRQYSRVNSVIALMHAVSLLKLLDTDLRQS